MTQPFEIGLTLAGAVSAGAYSAGVMDFLIEALDVWHAQKEEAATQVPRHEVRIKVMSGASAGSITAGVATAAMLHEHHPVHDPAHVGANRLYNTWVTGIDISKLLTLRDLQDEKEPVRSLLDSSELDHLAELALAQAGPVRRSYLADRLHLLFTVTNLRGVPYNLGFRGNYAAGHDFRMHGDHVHLVLGDTPQPTPGAIAMPWDKRQPGGKEGWHLLGQAALASSAFPIGLKPRTLEYDFGNLAEDLYWQRKWTTLDTQDEQEPCRYQQAEIAKAPQWVDPNGSEQAYPRKYDFVCVDGGSMNNEPLELARRILAAGDCRNPREGDKACRGLIMIDPFPDRIDDDIAHDHLIGAAVGLIGAWKAQSRFSAMDIELAQRPNVYSRYLIAPVRYQANGTMATWPIAGATAGAFGGFLSEDFRRHDFLLGRKNARAFLEKHFTLPETNPLFKNALGQWHNGWNEALAEKFGRDEDGRPYAGIGSRHLPIIPVMDSIGPDAPLPAWDTLYSHDRLDALNKPMRRRLSAVGQRLADKGFGDKPVPHGLIGLVVRVMDDKLADAAIETVRSELVKCGLLTARPKPQDNDWFLQN